MDTIYYRDRASRLVVIKSLAEAERVLRMHPWKRTAIYAKALHTVQGALAGNCTPKSAVAAFVTLINEQAVMVPRPNGRDLQAVDSLIHEFRRID